MSLEGGPKTQSLTSWSTTTPGVYERYQNRPAVSSVHKGMHSQAVKKRRSNQEQSEDERQQEREDRGRQFSPAEREAIIRFAKLRGILNLALQNDTPYRFDFNEKTLLFDLVNALTSEWVASFTPKELQSLVAQLDNNEGLMADRVG